MSLPEQIREIGYVSADALPTRSSTGAPVTSRFAEYGEHFVQPITPWRHALADEGSYHEFHNATLDDATTLQGHAAPVVVDIDATMTKPLFFIGLLASAPATKKLYLDWIELTVETPGTNGTNCWWADETDVISRYTSGGTALTVVNTNTGASNQLGTDVATFLGGAVVVPAETSANRKLGFDKYRQAIEASADRLIFAYGADGAGVQAAAAPTGRTVVVRRPPVVITPGSVYLLALAAASQSAASVYKVRGGCYYR